MNEIFDIRRRSALVQLLQALTQDFSRKNKTNLYKHIKQVALSIKVKGIYDAQTVAQMQSDAVIDGLFAILLLLGNAASVQPGEEISFEMGAFYNECTHLIEGDTARLLALETLTGLPLPKWLTYA